MKKHRVIDNLTESLICKEIMQDFIENNIPCRCIICNPEYRTDCIIMCNLKKHQIISQMVYRFITNLTDLVYLRKHNAKGECSSKIFAKEILDDETAPIEESISSDEYDSPIFGNSGYHSDWNHSENDDIDYHNDRY